ncbi:MAG: hypothetical protein ACI841_000495 [Planctomycetota bacterium]|jgi:hypothetical protein
MGSVARTFSPLRDVGDVAQEAGENALEKGDLATAAHHFERALEMRPADPELISLLLKASAKDPDAGLFWSEVWHLATCDERGRTDARGAVRSLLSPSPQPEKLCAATGDAVQELLRSTADKHKSARSKPDDELLARWSRRLARELARESPALASIATNAGPPDVEKLGTPWRKVSKDLERVMKAALAGGRIDEAIRAARILRGMAAQADFQDLQGEAPKGMNSVGGAAAAGLARARKAQKSRGETPWTLDDLEWLSQEESESFTRGHDNFAAPGLALSPRDWYRIETDCGLETLAGVTATIEDHHTRLVNWYGQDPFVDIQGTVRVVPEASGLEAEGAGFWWVGGFQGGNTTTVRFSVGTIEGLGHTLTHELTHRFDGAIFPGQPAWLSEGKATWTAGAYGHSSDTMFSSDYASAGSMVTALTKGYGGEEKLGELIDGTTKEYRDNYPVGHALYVFLNQWRKDGKADGALIFRERLEKYMRSLVSFRGKPREVFVEYFADGKKDRPADFGAFARLFGEFIVGFHWKSEKPWKNWFKGSPPGGDGGGFVYDEPTWVWTRRRAEPYFGDEQARLAAELFNDLGNRKDALTAYIWSLACDGRRPKSETPLAALLEHQKRSDAAWILRSDLPATVAQPERIKAPFIGQLPKCRALLAQFAEAAQEYEGARSFKAAASVRARHERLAIWLGSESLPISAPVLAALQESEAPRVDESARWLATDGWGEEGLTGFEERRKEGLWYSADNGDLHVGRKEPRKGTGKLDPRAHQRDAFVIGERYILPGAWRFKTRVQATTAYVSGAVVIGYTRRDRNIRFDFSSGDFMYAIGESDEVPAFEHVNWGLHGLFDREGGLHGTATGGTHDFGRERTAFDLELAVDGASVRAFIDGKSVATYTSPDGVAIEGRIGFALSMGSIRVQEPLVQRLERSRILGIANNAPIGLDITSPVAPPFAELPNRVIYGLPEASNGRLVFWIGRPEGAADEMDIESMLSKTRKSMQKIARLIDRDTFPQPLLVLFPEQFPVAKREAFAKEIQGQFLVPVTIQTHRFDGRLATGSHLLPDRGRNWLFFVDSCNVIRQVTPFFGQAGALTQDMRHWMTVFRDHGRPARELPDALRQSENDEEEDEWGDDE